MYYFIAPIFILLISGCFDSHQSNNSGSLSTDYRFIQAEVTRKVSTANLPDAGDYQEIQYLQFYKIPYNDCIYRITERMTISQVTQNYITEINERSSQADPENHYACPTQRPQFQSYEMNVWSISEYIRRKLDAINRALDLDLYARTYNLQSVRVISSQEEFFNGLRTQAIEMEVVTRLGGVYIDKQHISLDSLFLERFDMKLIRSSTGELTNYQTLTSYYVRKLGWQ